MPTCSECGQAINVGDWPYCEKGGGHRRARGGDAMGYIPPVVFRNAEGHTLFPGRSDERPPAGYQAVELRTARQREKFEKEFMERLKNDHQNEQLVEQLRNDFYSKPRIDALKQRMETLPPNLRGYAERAIERHNRRSVSYDAARYEPKTFFEAFHMDASNRERCDYPKSMSERQRR